MSRRNIAPAALRVRMPRIRNVAATISLHETQMANRLDSEKGISLYARTDMANAAGCSTFSRAA